MDEINGPTLSGFTGHWNCFRQIPLCSFNAKNSPYLDQGDFSELNVLCPKVTNHENSFKFK